MRVLKADGAVLGIMSRDKALELAVSEGLDLIEISPGASPPVARIMDFGKYQYDESKKQKLAKSKTKVAELKSIQVKVGTGEHDLALKAKKVSDWLSDGHRVRIELFLSGRLKYLDKKFLEERLERILRLVSTEYKTTEPVKKSPKGFTVVVERK